VTVQLCYSLMQSGCQACQALVPQHCFQLALHVLPNSRLGGHAAGLSVRHTVGYHRPGAVCYACLPKMLTADSITR
jgi:hypothetical protein